MNRWLLLFVLTPALAVAAPQKTKLVFVGTSLTYGYTFDSTPYPTRTGTALGVKVANMGVGGDRMAAIYQRWQLYAKASPFRAVVIEGCTNDLDMDGATGAACWNTMRTFCEEAEAAGQICVLVPVPPRWGHINWTNGEETERVALNTALAAYVAAHPAVLMVDVDTVLGNGSTPPGLNPAYDWADHLHLNAAGMQALANAVAALLD